MACLAAAALAATLALLQQPAQAFYLPGVAPHEYKDGDPVRRPAYFRRDLLISRCPSCSCGATPSELCCRCADLSEGQQAVLDEDLAALRVLPPALLQARHRTLSAQTEQALACLVPAPAAAASAGTRAERLADSAPARNIGQVENYAENLGEILRGDRIESSVYELQMKHDEYCKVLCDAQDYTKCAATPA